MKNSDENFFETKVKLGEIPSILYKYRSFSNAKHKLLLTNSELFHSSHKHFNDPYDCKIPVAYYLLEGNTKKQQDSFEKFVDFYRLDLNSSAKAFEVQRLIEEGRFNSTKWLEWAESNFFKTFDNVFGIISLTKIFDNILMWSHYADSHKGFCVGFDTVILFNNEDIFGGGGPVNYTLKYPIIDPMEDHMQQLMKQIYIKFSLWEYEKEYRLQKIYSADKVAKFPAEAVKEIIIGTNCSPIHKEEIIDIARSLYPRAIVKEAFAEKYNFNMGFDYIK